MTLTPLTCHSLDACPSHSCGTVRLGTTAPFPELNLGDDDGTMSFGSLKMNYGGDLPTDSKGTESLARTGILDTRVLDTVAPEAEALLSHYRTFGTLVQQPPCVAVCSDDALGPSEKKKVSMEGLVDMALDYYNHCHCYYF